MLLAGNVRGRDTSRRSAGETQGLGGYTKRRHHHQLTRVPTRSGAVGENPWVVNLRLNGQSVKFCIDTGAEVTVIPEQVYWRLHCPPLLNSQRTLRGPSQNKLQVQGRFTTKIQATGKETEQWSRISTNHSWEGLLLKHSSLWHGTGEEASRATIP